MGYQESLILIRPQGLFRKMVEASVRASHVDDYGAVPVSVITLKKNLNGIPKDTQLLWVAGDRCFINKAGIFRGNLPFHGLCNLKIIPAENLFDTPESHLLQGISFDMEAPPSSNAFLKRESIQSYQNRIKNQERER